MSANFVQLSASATIARTNSIFLFHWKLTIDLTEHNEIVGHRFFHDAK
jgi:hypothetical protein